MQALEYDHDDSEAYKSQTEKDQQSTERHICGRVQALASSASASRSRSSGAQGLVMMPSGRGSPLDCSETRFRFEWKPVSTRMRQAGNSPLISFTSSTPSLPGIEMSHSRRLGGDSRANSIA